MIQILRRLIGDKKEYHDPPWYTDEDLTDAIRFGIPRHNKAYTFETLPDGEVTLACYRIAIDLCHELAARNAPFPQFEVEGLSISKASVMSNWLELATVYREFYLTEIAGGLGAEGLILMGELTRQSYTTGRQVSVRLATPLEPVILRISGIEVSTRIVTLTWTICRHYDFFAYKLYRRTVGASTWTEIATTYNNLTDTYADDLVSAGKYEYKLEVWRGVSVERTSQYPWNPSIYEYLITPCNVVTVEVV